MFERDKNRNPHSGNQHNNPHSHNSHPFNYKSTEVMLSQLKKSLKEIQTVVENSKKALTFNSNQYTYQPISNKSSLKKDQPRNYNLNIDHSPISNNFGASRNGTSTTINFNISCSFEVDEEVSKAQMSKEKESLFQYSPVYPKNEQSLLSNPIRQQFFQHHSQNRDQKKKIDIKIQEKQKQLNSNNFQQKQVIQTPTFVISEKDEKYEKKSSKENIKKDQLPKNWQKNEQKQQLFKIEEQSNIYFSQKKKQKSLEHLIEKDMIQNNIISIQSNNKNKEQKDFRQYFTNLSKSRESEIKQMKQSLSPVPPDVEQFMLTQEERQSLNNTCTKNELENILMKQSMRRLKSGEKSKKYQILNTNTKISKFYESENNRSNEKVKGRSSVKKRIESPEIKSTNKKLKKSPYTPKKRVNFIEKSIQGITKSPANHNKKTSTPKSVKTKGKLTKTTASSMKYSHPVKSPQNISKKSVQKKVLDKHLATPPQSWHRVSFIKQMSKQCYVKRFLSQDDLSKLYEQFYHDGVPKYLWEERVIEKIIQKIHNYD